MIFMMKSANGHLPHAHSSWHQIYVILLSLATYSGALQITYCSTELVGATRSNSSVYQSNGYCQGNCLGFVFAVISGNDCWCSNLAPATQVDTATCNFACPGYPPENCGNPNESLYAYFNLGLRPSGTSSAITTSALGTTDFGSTSTSISVLSSTSASDSTSISTSASSLASTSTAANSGAATSFTNTDTSAIALYIQTAIPAADRTDPTNPCFVNQAYTYYSTPTWYTDWPTQVQSYYSASNQGATAACTLTASELHHTSSGLSTGAKAGIAVGVIVGVLLIAALIFFCLRRRKRNREGYIQGDETNKADLEHNETARQDIDYTRYSREHIDAESHYSTSHHGDEDFTALPTPPLPPPPRMSHTQASNSAVLAASAAWQRHDSNVRSAPAEDEEPENLTGPSRPWLVNVNGRKKSEISEYEQFFPALQEQNPYQIGPDMDSSRAGESQYMIPRKPVGTGPSVDLGQRQGGSNRHIEPDDGFGPSRVRHQYDGAANIGQEGGENRTWYHAM